MAINDENERAKVDASYLLGRGIRQVGQFLNTPRFEDTSRPTNIYALGSPTELAQRKQGVPGAGLAGTVADAAALIPRAGFRVSQNITRGVTGQAPITEPFVTNPVTQWAMAGSPQTSNVSRQPDQAAPSIPGKATASLPPAPITSGFRTGKPSVGAEQPRTAMFEATPFAGRGVAPLPEPGYTTLPNGTEVITQAGYDAAQARIVASDAAAKAAGRPTTAEVNAAGMKWLGEQLTPQREVMNGNVSTTFGGTGGRTTTMPFPTAPMPTGPTGWRLSKEGKPEEQDAAIRQYNAEVAAYKELTGQIPLEQAQAGLAQTQAAELPAENLSQQGLRTAQAKALETPATKVAPPHYGTTKSVTPQGIIEEPYVIVQDPATGGFRKAAISSGSGSQATSTLRDAVATITDSSRRAKIAEYIKGHPEEDQASIAQRIVAGEL